MPPAPPLLREDRRNRLDGPRGARKLGLNSARAADLIRADLIRADRDADHDRR